MPVFWILTDIDPALGTDGGGVVELQIGPDNPIEISVNQPGIPLSGIKHAPVNAKRNQVFQRHAALRSFLEGLIRR